MIADELQPFEKYPRLAAWIEKLANRRVEGFSHSSWCAFLSELNEALTKPAEGEPVVLSASDAACYEYPGEDEAPLRTAFVAGAVRYTRPVAWPDREAVARIIDPVAMATQHVFSSDGCPNVKRNNALSKADAIIAMLTRGTDDA